MNTSSTVPFSLDNISLLEIKGNFQPYRPFKYPWAFEAWKTQQQMHWLPEEVPMADDVSDWKSKLNETDKNFLTNIFRFFTQADIDVQDCYMTKYGSVFKPIEIKMMLSAFSSNETVHIESYSFLIQTLGMPDKIYSEFLQYKEMKDKHTYLESFNVDNKKELAKTLAVFGAFTEGLQLFSTFALLLNYSRHNLMKGMSQVISWSIRDEENHCSNIIKLFRTLIQENPEIWDADLRKSLYEACTTTVHFEDAFIDLCYRTSQTDEIRGLRKEDVRRFVRYLADKRLLQLGLKEVYMIENNPLEWFDVLTGHEFANFFDSRVTEYSKAATTGQWEEAYLVFDNVSN